MSNNFVSFQRPSVLTEAFGEKFGKYRSVSKSTTSETSSGNEKSAPKTEPKEPKTTYQVERPKSLGSTKDLLKSNVEKTQAEVAAKFPQVRLRRATSSLPTNSPTQEAIRKFEQGFYAERLNTGSLGRRPNKAPTYRRGSAQPTQERLILDDHRVFLATDEIVISYNLRKIYRSFSILFFGTIHLK